MSDRGGATVELAAGIGLLLLPLAVAVLVAPAWVSARTTAVAAAQAAGRIVATGPGTAESEASARAHAVEVASTRAYDVVHVRLCPDAGSCLPLTRDRRVVVEVEILVPAVDLPGVGSFGARWVRGRATTPVDPYRSLP